MSYKSISWSVIALVVLALLSCRSTGNIGQDKATPHASEFGTSFLIRSK